MKILTTTLHTWQIELTSIQAEQFERYAAELRGWNEQLNLTTITDPEGIAVRHFLDSLRVAQSWGVVPASLIDVGAGAGFPGLPLKILHPEIDVTLVESIEKKAHFLRHVASELGLAGVEVVVARAEAIGREPQQRERYDLAVARAVAELRVLAEYCLPLVRVGGRFIAPKGANVAQEVEQARGSLLKLGGSLHAVEPVELPGIEPRTLVVIDKMAPTPAQYPRAVGIPAKRPL